MSYRHSVLSSRRVILLKSNHIPRRWLPISLLVQRRAQLSTLDVPGRLGNDGRARGVKGQLVET
jgi:hypothetical protein